MSRIKMSPDSQYLPAMVTNSDPWLFRIAYSALRRSPSRPSSPTDPWHCYRPPHTSPHTTPAEYYPPCRRPLTRRYARPESPCARRRYKGPPRRAPRASGPVPVRRAAVPGRAYGRCRRSPGQRGDVRLHRRSGIILDHRHTPAAAGTQFAQHEAVPVTHVGCKRNEHGCHVCQRLRLIDLRADVAV